MTFFPFGLGDTVDATHPAVSANVLGGKGAGLVWMASQGVPVPPGFVIPVSVWADYDKAPKTTMKAIAKLLPEYLAKLDAHFGYLPLLSVRSGSRVSCPGMMDTILNVGLDATTQDSWCGRLGTECYANSLHRLVVMYGSVVKGIRRQELDSNLMSAMAAYTRETGEAEFPSALVQLLGAIEAVFKSWDNDRAKVYRKLHSIPREWGTAVTVQAMVFGNLNDQSGTGVLFTRNPDTGGALVTGEFLINAQGEDVVAGTRTPVPLEEMKAWNPAVYDELLNHVIGLENLKKDVQDVEFTVQDGKLYLLQTRTAKRSATAAMKIALDMHTQGLIDAKTAVSRVTIRQFDQAQMAHLDPKFTKPAAFTGIGASGGMVSGTPVFTKEDAINCKEPCILITAETTPDDIEGMHAAAGVITMVGGLTSHAAVVARGFDRACIVGVGQSVDAFKDVETVSMDGTTGRIWTEAVPIVGGQTNGLISAFSALVFEALGAVPVITAAPEGPLPEALLYLGAQVLNPEAAVQVIADTLKKVDRLYLDLTPATGSVEAEYLEIVAAHNPAQYVLDLLAMWVNKAALGKLVLIETNKTGLKTDLPVVRTATNLRDVVLAQTEVIANEVGMADPAMAKVLAWKKAEGVSVVSVGAYTAGSKSVVSVSQALQVLAEAEGGQ